MRHGALEEYAPNHFMVHDIRVRPFIRGEGDVEGNRFVLTSWRRDGLMARLAERGLVMVTIESLTEALPPLPAPSPIADDVRWQPLGHPSERWSYYDPRQRAVVACETVSHAEQHGVWLHPGCMVRRRRGRGQAEWYRSQPQGTHTIQYTPLAEDTALLQGLAQATGYTHAPIALRAGENGDVAVTIPLLPKAHQSVLARCATSDRNGLVWQCPTAHLPLVVGVLARVQVVLTNNESNPHA
ncbi:MAG: hypothetical protein EBS29_05140 [Chloroflexia bacterium]|nr:hypothetical protein [Chloroflexia bacterium]